MRRVRSTPIVVGEAEVEQDDIGVVASGLGEAVPCGRRFDQPVGFVL
jgi:hypothetical protein